MPIFRVRRPGLIRRHGMSSVADISALNDIQKYDILKKKLVGQDLLGKTKVEGVITWTKERKA